MAIGFKKDGYALVTVIFMGLTLVSAAVILMQMIGSYTSSVQYAINVERSISASNAGISSAAYCVNSYNRVSWSGVLTPDKGCRGDSVGPVSLNTGLNWTSRFEVTGEMHDDVVSLSSEGVTALGARLPVSRTFNADIPRVELLADPKPASVNMVGGFSNTRQSKVATSSAHNGSACAIDGDGLAYCWGRRSYGVLGDGLTSGDTDVPVPVSTSGVLSGKRLVDISMGNEHTCALDDQGKAYCWGRGSQGRLGDGGSSNRPSPVEVRTTGVLKDKFLVQISAGYSSTCAVDDQGKVYCWGDNSGGRLGNNTTSSSSVPIAVSTSGALNAKFVTRVTVGAGHACAIDSQGKAYCWGEGNYGRLGIGGRPSRQMTPAPVIDNGALQGKSLISIQAAETSTCAIDSLGEMYCWGVDYWTETGSSDVPIPIDDRGVLDGKRIVNMKLSVDQYCVIDDLGALYCWGSSSDGKLGDGTLQMRRVPTPVDTSGHLSGKVITDVSIGAVFTCATDSDAAVYCWGANWSGQLGNGRPPGANYTSPYPQVVVKSWTPHAPSESTEVGVFTGQTVSSGYMHVCAVSNHRAYCWGRGSEGQLGHGVSVGSTVPVAVRSATSFTNASITQIATGAYHSCAIADEQIYCWGDNRAGQLGIGSRDSTHAAVPVSISTGLSGKDITQVDSGYYHTCAIADGQVYCWGDNSYGQLGDGTTEQRLTPKLISGSGALAGRTVSQISTGAYHTCALAEGSVYCWGHNDSGAIGNGDLVDVTVPVLVSGGAIGGRTVSQIEAGGYHTCAVSGGSVYCWGRNNYGQAGIEDSSNAVLPTLTESSPINNGQVIQLSSSSFHTCAITLAGDIYCWGQGGSGRIGLPTDGVGYTHVPQRVNSSAPLSGQEFDQISTGGFHSCSVSQALIYCWGLNNEGMLGNGTLDHTHVPRKISRLSDINRLIRY